MTEEKGRALPLVAGRAGSTGVWAFAGVMAVVGALLFYALEARRSSLASPDVMVPTETGAGQISSPPELIIPSDRALRPDFSLILPDTAAAVARRKLRLEARAAAVRGPRVVAGDAARRAAG